MNQVDAVILNPASNGGAGRRRWQQAIASDEGRALGLGNAPAHEGPPEGLGAWMLERIAGGARRFVIAGGDGTMNSALNAWLELRASRNVTEPVAFGAVGIGSSNDFHKPFGPRIAGLPTRLDFDRAFAHDAGLVEITSLARSSRRAFFVNASVGVTADANDRFNRGGAAFTAMKRAWIDGAIGWAALATFARYRNLDVELRIEGSESDAEELELSLTNLGIIKKRHFSGSFHYPTGPAPDDGLFGVHVAFDMNRPEMLATLGRLARGRFEGAKTRSWQGTRSVEVRAAKPTTELALETDGEISRGHRFRFTPLPKEVLLCP